MERQFLPWQRINASQPKPPVLGQTYDPCHKTVCFGVADKDISTNPSHMPTGQTCPLRGIRKHNGVAITGLPGLHKTDPQGDRTGNTAKRL